MKAIVFRDPETAIEVADVDLAAPKAGEVRVKIAAAGVCHSDLHVKRGEWDAPAPLVMGHEGSGVVVELGEGVNSLAVGDHVVLSWVPPCGECRYCRSGHEARCHKAATVVAPKGVLYDGTSRLSKDGELIHHYLGVSSFAEEVVVPASGAIKVRDDAPLDVIAVVGCAVATGVGAVLNTAAVEPGSTVVVIGCGGVGLNVLQGARISGATTIVAVDVKDAALEFAKKFGATHVVNARKEDAVARVQALTGGGAHFAFEAYGSGATTRMAVDMLRKQGTAVIVGIAPIGDTAAIEPVVLTRGEKTITGTYYGSAHPRQDMPRIADWAERGRLDVTGLVTRRYPLADINRAYEDIDTDAVGRGVIVFP